jgi:hypothetical protein
MPAVGFGYPARTVSAAEESGRSSSPGETQEQNEWGR